MKKEECRMKKPKNITRGALECFCILPSSFFISRK